MRALQIGVADGGTAASRYDARHDPCSTDYEAIAAEALAEVDDAREIAPFSAHYPALPSMTPIASRPVCARCERRAASA
jgi:hypothetical protein